MVANIVVLIVQYADNRNWDHSAEPFRKLLEKRRKLPQSANQLPCQLERYHEGIARCILEKVTVENTGRLHITFKGGASVEQSF